MLAGPEMLELEITESSIVAQPPREALALISSNAFSVGIAALSVARSLAALRARELSAALSYERFYGNVSALPGRVQRHARARRVHGDLDSLVGLLESRPG